MKDKEIKKMVKKGYAEIAAADSGRCARPSCCPGTDLAGAISKNAGYKDSELKHAPEGANLGLGCGNPVALASLKKGETVLDLGSGAGLDCFIAADRVGGEGKVIGVDMTPEMVKKARVNAKKGNYRNVEFRLGEIENLPVADGSIDIVISNCVINLSPDKRRAFREAYRVLKENGRLALSDLVLRKELPGVIKKSAEAYIGCLSGAVLKEEYLRYIRKAGFSRIKVIGESPFGGLRTIADSVISVKISAIKRSK